MIVTLHSDDELVLIEAYSAPKRDRIDLEAALHAYRRARDYAQRVASAAKQVAEPDKAKAFAAAMDEFLVFCLFCRRYLELVPESGLAGYSISVRKAPQGEPHLGASQNTRQTKVSLKALIKRVIHCIFHYPLYKKHPDSNDSILAGCEVKSDRHQVYELLFSDVVDVFLNHVPSVLKTQRAEWLAQDRIERDQRIAEHKQRGHV